MKDVIIDESDDFGFDDNDVSNELDESEDEMNLVEDMYQLIMPLLDNLLQNPKSDTIRWPKRIDQVEELISRLDEIRELNKRIRKYE